MTALLLALLASAPVAAGPGLGVSGQAALTAGGELAVTVELSNPGPQPTGAVTVLGELAGRFDEARLPGGVGPGERGAVQLLFPPEVPRAGVYALALLLDYTPPAAGAAPSALSQRAFLLLNLGAAAPPPVRLSAPEVTLHDRATLPVTVESADGAAHRLRVRVLGPRGLNPEHPSAELDLPAGGRATVEVPLLRGSVPRPSRQGLLLLAETVDGEVARAAAATAVVEVAAARPWLPRLRPALVAAAVALLGAAGALEWRHTRRRRSAPPA